MELTREQTIEALKSHVTGKRVCGRCPLCDIKECMRELHLNALHYLTEDKAILSTSQTSNSYRDKARPAEDGKEPAPSANGTSSTNNNLYLNDSMIFKICQEGILNLLDTLLEGA